MSITRYVYYETQIQLNRLEKLYASIKVLCGESITSIRRYGVTRICRTACIAWIGTIWRRWWTTQLRRAWRLVREQRLSTRNRATWLEWSETSTILVGKLFGGWTRKCGLSAINWSLDASLRTRVRTRRGQKIRNTTRRRSKTFGQLFKLDTRACCDLR